MNRRLALTVAGSTALVAISAGAAIAANLGILTASPKAGVGQLDSTRVAELAVSTPASIAAAPPVAVVVPVEAPALVEALPTLPVRQTAARSTWVAPAEAPAVEAPVAVEPQEPSPTPNTHTEIGTGDVEGSLDDHVQDDAFLIESPHQVKEVHVSERIR